METPARERERQSANAQTKTKAKNKAKTKAKAIARVPEILSSIQANYVRNKTLVAEFTQVNESAALKTKKTSQGRILIKRPNKLRWETLEPERNILVSDGRKFWFYTPPFDEEEKGQVIERRNSQVQSKLANALISGDFSALSGEGIQETEPNHFLIQPSPGTAGTVVEARVVVDPERKLIQKVSLRHSDGNTSEISLTRIQLGESLGDELFSFVPPPNTDVIRE